LTMSQQTPTKDPDPSEQALCEGQGRATQGSVAWNRAILRLSDLRRVRGRQADTATPCRAAARLHVKPVGERSAGKPHAAFDERGRETGLCPYRTEASARVCGRGPLGAYSHRARPRLYVRREKVQQASGGRNHPNNCRWSSEADEQLGRATGQAEAS